MLDRMGPDPVSTSQADSRLVPQARYILPSFVEHSSWGVKESNPYNKLFEERIIFLGVQVDDASANDIMAQLLVLESLDPDRDITMYINSPGGSFTSLMAIYDTMQYVRCPISTVCIGQAASMGSLLLTAGEKGMRFSLPNSRIMVHQPSGGYQGQATDIMIHAQETQKLKTRLNEIYHHHTGKPVKDVEAALERDNFMSPEDAKDWGLIDEILSSRDKSTDDAKS